MPSVVDIKTCEKKNIGQAHANGVRTRPVSMMRSRDLSARVCETERQRSYHQ